MEQQNTSIAWSSAITPDASQRASGVGRVTTGSYMTHRLATAESVYERLKPVVKSVQLKLRVYSAPESVVGIVNCGISLAERGCARSMNAPSVSAVVMPSARHVR